MGAQVSEPTAQSPGPSSRVNADGHLPTKSLASAALQHIEIVEPPNVEARAFLQFGQRHLIHCKTTRIEWRSRDGRSRLRPLVEFGNRVLISILGIQIFDMIDVVVGNFEKCR